MRKEQWRNASTFIPRHNAHFLTKLSPLLFKSIIDSPLEAGADPGIYFGGGPNQGPQSKVEGEARIERAKRPSIEGEARVEGAKRPRIEGEARTEGEAREKAGGGVWGGGSVSPSPENVWKIKLETIHFGAYLKQLFEMTNKMV